MDSGTERGARPVDAAGGALTEERATTPTTIRDRVRWGPVWAGLVVTLATYVLLQLALITTGAYDAVVGEVQGVNEGALLSGVVGLVAFLVGGLTAGASAVWRDVVNGALHGIVMWGLALVALLALAVLGGGFAAGAVGELADQFDADPLAEEFDAAQAADDAQQASGIALISLTLALVASVGGGVAGAKMWPRDRSDVELDLGSDAAERPADDRRPVAERR